MRVTKIIREYIEKRANEVYAPKIDAIGSDYYTEKAEVQSRIDEIIANANAQIHAILEETGFGIRYGMTKAIDNCKDICKEDIEDSIRTEIRKLKSEKHDKVSEIIVTLELGGTKAELEEMLKNLE